MAKKSVKKEAKEIKEARRSNSIARYFRQVKKIYSDSDSFFKSVEKQDLIGVLRFFAIFYLIFFVLSMIVSLISTKLGIYVGEISFRLVLWNFIGFVLMSAVLVFLAPAFVYLALKILKVRKGYLNSFKPVAYGMVLMKGYLIVLMIITLILQLIFPVDMSPLAAMQTAQDPEIVRAALSEFMGQTNAIVSIIISGLIYLIAIIHSVLFSIKGLAKFNNISKGKAFGSVVLALVIAFVIAVILFLLIAYLSNGTSVV